MTIFSTISTEILIKPSQLHCTKSYILEMLRAKYENKIFSSKYGYITEILGIEEIKFKCLFFAYHDGSMVYDVKFNAICENPQKGDYIDCQILYYDDIMFSFVPPMEIIIRYDNLDHLKHNDTQKNKLASSSLSRVKVDETQLDMNRNIIKILAVLTENIENAV